MSRIFTPEAVRAYRAATAAMEVVIRTTVDDEQIMQAVAEHDLALLAAFGCAYDDILAWAFATGQVDHEGRPV